MKLLNALGTLFLIGVFATLQADAAPFATTGLAVVAPTFSGGDGNTSFIRLANIGAASSTFTVTVVGSPTGHTYGTATFNVPAGASPQYSLSQVLAQASAPTLTGGDDSYALYVQNSDQNAGFEHVIYNGANGFFENVSACTMLLEPATGAILTNVHTSGLSSYPSQVRIHNYGTQAATYRVTVSDGATGTSIGTVDLQIDANTSKIYQETYFEQQLHWTPTSSQLHANLSFVPVGTSNFYATVAQYIFNQQFSAYVNMSELCAINARSPASASASTSYSGTIAASSTVNGTLTVTVAAAVTASAPVAKTAAVEVQQATSTATGVLSFAGASTNLTGSYDSGTSGVTLSGGGYALTGTIANGVYSGNYTGPNATSGGFQAMSGTAAAVVAYCGNWQSPAADGGSGAFNIVIAGTKLSGLVTGVNGAGTYVTISGTASGTNFSGAASDSSPVVGSTQGTSMSVTFSPKHGGTIQASGTACAIPSG